MPSVGRRFDRVEPITDPLLHMIRNSMDHGIEPPAVRQAAQARRAGCSAALRQGGCIVVENVRRFDSTRIEELP